MGKRPTSVTVIGWILIALGSLAVIGLYSTWQILTHLSAQPPAIQEMMAKNPMPLWLQMIFMVVGVAVNVVAGIFLLRGANWSRWMYVVWTGLGMVIGLVTSPVKLMIVPGLLIYGVIAFFLFRPAANAYFTGAGHDTPQD